MFSRICVFTYLILGCCVVDTVGQPDAALARLFKQGKNSFDKHQVDDAQLQLSRCLSDAQKKGNAWYESTSLTWLGECAFYEQDYAATLALTLRAKAIADAHLNTDTVRHYFRILQNIGVASSYLGKMEQQRAYYNAALLFCKEHFPDDREMLADAYFNLSASHYHVFALDSALLWFDSTLSIATTQAMPNLRATTLLNRGVIYATLLDYDKAIQTQQEALRLTKDPNEQILNNYHLVKYFAELNQYEKASAHLSNARELIKKHGKTQDQYNFLVELKACELFYKFDKAAFRQTLDQLFCDIPSDVDNLLWDYKKTLNWMARAYIDDGDLSAAKFTCMTALQIRPDKKYSEISIESYRLLADILSQQGDYAAALVQLQWAMIDFTPNFHNRDVTKNPTAAQFTNLEFSATVLSAKMKVWMHAYKHDANPEHLRQALAVYQIADTLLYNRRRLLQSDISRTHLATYAHPLHQQATELYHTLYTLDAQQQWIDAAFRCMERSRSLLVSENLAHRYAETAVPAHITQRERILQQTDYRLRQLISKAEDGRFTPQQQQAWQQERYQIEQAWTAFLDSIETHYPDYYRNKYDLPFVTPDDVQRRLLASTEVLLSFSEQDTVVFCVGISKYSSFFERLTPPQPLHQYMPALRKSILSKSVAYYPLAYDLYSALLKPMEAKWRGKDLIMLPDGWLWYVPFSALPIQPVASNRPQDQTFLVSRTSVRWLYAAHAALMPKPIRQAVHHKWAVLAPFSKNGYETAAYSLPPLRGSEVEGKNIRARFEKHPGILLMDTAATLHALYATAPHTLALHLSTHTHINNRDPNLSTLYFAMPPDSSQNSLTIYDIISQYWALDLVVMSACEGIEGPLQGSEGVAGLARGFALAGCNNLLACLWVANDESTVTLMDAYYEQLADGQGKSDALRQAQHSYGQSGAHFLNLHPFYWAGFVYIGDNEPLALSDLTDSSRWNGWLALLLLGVFLLGLAYHRRGDR